MQIYSHTFESPIWKVLPDHSGEALAIAIRDREKRTFSCAYLKLGSPTPPLFLTDDLGWWKGLKEVHEGNILLHTYADPGLPIQAGIFVYEGEKARLSWVKEKGSFLGLQEEGIWLREEKDSIFYDWKGNKQRQANFSPKEIQKFEDKRSKNLAFPYAYIDAHESFGDLAALISTKSERPAEVQIDHLAFKDYQIFNFYHKNPDASWTQMMAVRKGEKWTEFRQTASALKGLGLDPFFVFKDYLIWIEDQQKLCYLILE